MDAGFELGGSGALVEVARVHLADEVEFAALLFAGEAGRQIEVKHRGAGGSEERALVGGGQVAVAPHDRAIDRGSARVLQDDVAGEVLIRAA